MIVDRPDNGHETVATLDIETTGTNAESSELVSIGLAVHKRGQPLSSTKYKHFHREPSRSESDLARYSFDWLDKQEPDALITYNGKVFDFSFIYNRMNALDERVGKPNVLDDGEHIDIFTDDAPGRQSKLEETYEAYVGEAPSTVQFRGVEVDGEEFGVNLGPEYLSAVEEENHAMIAHLQSVTDMYLRQDLLFNILIYYFDIGEIDPEDADGGPMTPGINQF